MAITVTMLLAEKRRLEQVRDRAKVDLASTGKKLSEVNRLIAVYGEDEPGTNGKAKEPCPYKRCDAKAIPGTGMTRHIRTAHNPNYMPS